MQINKCLISPSKSCKDFFFKCCIAETKWHSQDTWRRALSPQLLNMLSVNTNICGSLYQEERSSLQLSVFLLLPAFSHLLPQQPLLHLFFLNSLYINHLALQKISENLLKPVEKTYCNIWRVTIWGFFKACSYNTTTRSSVLPTLVCCCKQEKIQGYKHKKHNTAELLSFASLMPQCY